MEKKVKQILTLTILTIMLLAACSPINLHEVFSDKAVNPALNLQVDEENFNVESTEQKEVKEEQLTLLKTSNSTTLVDLQNALTSVYEKVNPSVVSIQVFLTGNMSLNSMFPNQPGRALGSGFTWDKKGHIITNNHVVENASNIEVTFIDGTILEAKLVGADADSDMAVLLVDAPEELLVPITLADSDNVKVGQLAIAIGNPFGLSNTMTVGIVSALGRTLPAREGIGPTYTIPKIIQTDAPINPGNSGGVLVDAEGQLLGITTAIESSVNSNAGIGFVIPTSIVKKVAPVLIEKGKYDHPWLGITSSSLTNDIATVMGLDQSTRGVLVIEVVSGGPADQAGIRASNDTTTIDGFTTPIGGDVITAIDGTPVKESEDLIAYISTNTNPGQKVTLTIIRDKKEMKIEVTLGIRPAQASERITQGQIPQLPVPPLPNQPGQTKPRLGIVGLDINSTLAKELDLSVNKGILIIEVTPGSPAEEAGLRGGSKTITYEGEEIKVGGDIITAIDDQPVASVFELRTILATYVPNARVTLTIIRDGNTFDVTVQLGQ